MDISVLPTALMELWPRINKLVWGVILIACPAARVIQASALNAIALSICIITPATKAARMGMNLMKRAFSVFRKTIQLLLLVQISQAMDLIMVLTLLEARRKNL